MKIGVKEILLSQVQVETICPSLNECVGLFSFKLKRSFLVPYPRTIGQFVFGEPTEILESEDH